MKTSDYISVIMIAIVGTILAYFLMNALLGDPVDLTKSFEYIETVNSELVEPDANIFNSFALNPTVEVYVGSCVDSDQDGKLDDDELKMCGEANPESTMNASNRYTSESGLTQEENAELNRQNGLAPSTSESQRADTLGDIEQRAAEINSQNQQSASDAAARQETTSTGS